MALRRLRSSASVILREMPPPRAGVGHQHRIAAGERQVGGQRRALVAALLLDDLDQQDLAALDDFLDLVVAARARRPVGDILQRVAADLLDAARPLRRRRLRPRRRASSRLRLVLVRRGSCGDVIASPARRASASASPSESSRGVDALPPMRLSAPTAAGFGARGRPSRRRRGLGEVRPRPLSSHGSAGVLRRAARGFGRSSNGSGRVRLRRDGSGDRLDAARLAVDQRRRPERSLDRLSVVGLAAPFASAASACRSCRRRGSDHAFVAELRRRLLARLSLAAMAAAAGGRVAVAAVRALAPRPPRAGRAPPLRAAPAGRRPGSGSSPDGSRRRRESRAGCRRIR